MSDGDQSRLSTYLFLVVFVGCAWFFGGGGWNQNATFDLTRAMVERRTFAIDAYPGNTYDVSFHGGHVYANKAPGLSLLAAGPYAVIYAGERLSGIDPSSPLAATLNLWLCTVAVCASAAAGLAVLVFLYARRYVAAVPAMVLALVIAFATYLFPWSTVLFAHVPSAFFLFASFLFLRDRPLLAGACGGLAVLCNYAAAPALACIVLLGGRRKIARVVTAGLPFAAVLLAYQAICFGSPFTTSVEATSGIFQTKGATFGVLVAPRPAVVFAILFSRYRGLFFLSPVLVLALAGGVLMIRRRAALRDLAVSAAVFAAFVVVNASFNNWDGGGAFGPRYLIPVVPFLAVPMTFALGAMRALWVVLAAISFCFNFAVAAVNPQISRLVGDPLFRYTFPLLVTGRLPVDTPPNPPVAWKAMLGHVSVNRVPADDFVAFRKHPAGSREAEWASFNLGEIFAEGSLLSLLPVLLWIAGGSAFLLRRSRGSPV